MGEQNVATTIITAIEIIRGRHDYVLKAADGAQLLLARQLLNASEEMLMDIQIFRFDVQAAAEFALPDTHSRASGANDDRTRPRRPSSQADHACMEPLGDWNPLVKISRYNRREIPRWDRAVFC